MIAKHSQGKWIINKDGSITPRNNKGCMIAQICSANNNDSEKEANGNLIVSAPDMLETIIRSYLELLMNMPLEYRCTTNGQILLVNLRSSLEFLFNGHSQETQEFFEDLVCRIKLGEINIEQAIKEII